MSLFTDDARAKAVNAHRHQLNQWARGHGPNDRSSGDQAMEAALDAAIAALDETELIEKAAKAAISHGWGLDATSISDKDRAQARAVLVAIGLLPEETRP